MTLGHSGAVRRRELYPVRLQGEQFLAVILTAFKTALSSLLLFHQLSAHSYGRSSGSGNLTFCVLLSFLCSYEWRQLSVDDKELRRELLFALWMVEN